MYLSLGGFLQGSATGNESLKILLAYRHNENRIACDAVDLARLGHADRVRKVHDRRTIVAHHFLYVQHVPDVGECLHDLIEKYI